jgi:hypothetical protein
VPFLCHGLPAQRPEEPDLKRVSLPETRQKHTPAQPQPARKTSRSLSPSRSPTAALATLFTTAISDYLLAPLAARTDHASLVKYLPSLISRPFRRRSSLCRPRPSGTRRHFRRAADSVHDSPPPSSNRTPELRNITEPSSLARLAALKFQDGRSKGSPLPPLLRPWPALPPALIPAAHLVRLYWLCWLYCLVRRRSRRSQPIPIYSHHLLLCQARLSAP